MTETRLQLEVCLSSFAYKIWVMKLLFAFLTCMLFHQFCFSQVILELNKEVKGVPISKKTSATFTISLKKAGVYRFLVAHKGVAVLSVLMSADKKKIEKEPNEIDGFARFEYSPDSSGIYQLAVTRFEHPSNTDSGTITVLVESLSKAEIEKRAKIVQQMAAENEKNVTTIDIDHFWEAYAGLKNCKSFKDSATVFQELYLDRATNGLLDFMSVRDLTAERFVKAVSKNATYYQSVKQNTEVAKKAVPIIEEVFTSFKQIYPDFKPFKVCFAIGIKNTGGTYSNKFVLIGTEVTLGIDELSEEQLLARIKSVVAHECVHTQQKLGPDTNGLNCPLLYQALHEGSCDFIAELVTGQSKENEYFIRNEKKLWDEFKSELCNNKLNKWLYNGGASKDRPADLGYFIGYAIAKEYYTRAEIKKQAVADIIEMTNPVRFLELSHYDQKVK
jgi:uncharacterized protein YjaZ